MLLGLTAGLVLLVPVLCGSRSLVSVWLAPYAVGVSALGALTGWSRPVVLGLQTAGLVLAAVFLFLHLPLVRRPTLPRLPVHTATAPARDRTVVVPDQYRPRSRDVVS